MGIMALIIIQKSSLSLGNVLFGGGGGGKVCGTLLLISIILETATQDTGALPGLHLWEWAAGRLGWGQGGEASSL